MSTAVRLEAPNLVVDRQGTFEYPVVVATLGSRGHMIETTVCTLCADAGGYLARRPTACLPGVECPVCQASLCPTRS